MLFGVVEWSDIYITPHGAVLTTNIISEICVGTPYCMLAMIAAPMLYFCPKDLEPEEQEGQADTMVMFAPHADSRS
jgi:hypothetical protein